MEQTVRGLADYWVQNINKTTDSQYVTLAREIVVHAHDALQQQAREFLLRRVCHVIGIGRRNKLTIELLLLILYYM